MLNRRDGFYRANLVIFLTTKTPGPNETLVLAEDECGDKNIKMFSSVLWVGTGLMAGGGLLIYH